MITHPIVSDLARIVAAEARSGKPTAPIRPERIRQPRGSVLAATRLRVTSGLRWVADAIEPKPADLATTAPQQGC